MRDLDDLVCDCHLQWLPNFINTTSTDRPRFDLETDGSMCSNQNGLSITDPEVDFSAMCTGKQKLNCGGGLTF